MYCHRSGPHSDDGELSGEDLPPARRTSAGAGRPEWWAAATRSLPGHTSCVTTSSPHPGAPPLFPSAFTLQRNSDSQIHR